MDITIKNIRNLAIVNLAVFGLVACTSSPSPWTQAENSPRGSERASETQAIPSGEVITDTTLNDPVLLADPEPEPIVMQEPDAMAAPEVITPVVVADELTPEQEIMELPTSSYAVQAYAGKTMDSLESFKAKNDLPELKAVRTERSGAIIYVLVDIQPDRASANAAANSIEAKTGSKPWVRSVAGLQKIVAQ